MYYARSENQSGEKETVQHHLNRVSELAGCFASSFNADDEAAVAGLLHDFGKYSKLFAGVLDGTEQHVNHEAAGAFISMNCYKREAETIARVIFGHHKGLEYDIEAYLKDSFVNQGSVDKHNRRYALSGNAEYLESYRIFSSEISLPKIKLKKKEYSYCRNRNVAEMLYTRMLFSCLVDGDYSASAEHYDKEYLLKSSGQKLDAEKMLSNLMTYRESIRAKSHASQGINQIRDELFDSCIQSAKKEPGLFTLTAPTGTGKTLSLLAFALSHAKIHNKTRVIIVLPFLSIIEQNAKIYSDICGEILEDHSQTEYGEQSELYSARWDYPVIITTSVKFFEALFKHKPVDCRKLHSIANSVVIFDEAQSLPSHLIGITLDSINALCKRYNCSVVFSTATQPSFDYRSDIEWKPNEIVAHPQKMYCQTRRVKIDWRINKSISLTEIAGEMAMLDSCCAIVNMKRHSVELFEALKSLCEDDSIFHISTDMCAAHRIDNLNKIKARLDAHLPCRIVSTQCIEAGVDLDVRIVYRALAPLDSIIQSAGRCNRNGSSELGQVIVFEPDEDRLYPDDYYEYAANRVKHLLSRHDIDICNLNHIDEYYRLLFSDHTYDDKKLLDAINRMDFEETDNQYRLIKKAGVNIIVPYKGKIQLYNEVKQQALEEGLTPYLMKKANQITVSSYNREKVKEICEMVYYRGSYGRQKSESNWYILHDESLYSDLTGLQLTKDTSLNYIN